MADFSSQQQAGDPPLKILAALQYYLPHRTGVPIHLQRVAEELVRRGHLVTVLTARYSNTLPRDEVAGVRVIRAMPPSSCRACK